MVFSKGAEAPGLSALASGHADDHEVVAHSCVGADQLAAGVEVLCDRLPVDDRTTDHPAERCAVFGAFDDCLIAVDQQLLELRFFRLDAGDLGLDCGQAVDASAKNV